MTIVFVITEGASFDENYYYHASDRLIRWRARKMCHFLGRALWRLGYSVQLENQAHIKSRETPTQKHWPSQTNPRKDTLTINIWSRDWHAHNRDKYVLFRSVRAYRITSIKITRYRSIHVDTHSNRCTHIELTFSLSHTHKHTPTHAHAHTHTHTHTHVRGLTHDLSRTFS